MDGHRKRHQLGDKQHHRTGGARHLDTAQTTP